MPSGNQMRREALEQRSESSRPETCHGCGAPYEPACEYCGRGAVKLAELPTVFNLAVLPNLTLPGAALT